MQLLKRTYSIEKSVLNAFERSVNSGHRSTLINSLLKKFLADNERQKIREAIISCAETMNDIYLSESESWLHIEEEVHENFTRTTKTRRRSTGKV